MKVKTLIFIFSLITTLGASAGCGLDWSKLYFKNNEGEREFNRRTKKYELFHESYHSFKPSYPKSVNIHIPFKGDCSGVDFKGIKTYRMIGKQEFSGEKGQHERHGLTPVGLTFEKKPFEYVDPQASIVDNEVILKKVKILDAIQSTKEGDHVWKMRFDIFIKGTDGIDNMKYHTADFPLIH